jgi:hypothetical protein
MSTDITQNPSPSKAPLQTAVLFLIFCRPDTTRHVFEAIRAARPLKLYIAADGPRRHRPGDAEKCDAARRIATAVDWECEVHTLFRSTNMGLGRGISDAITWFLEEEEEGIILEDDCLPSASFFAFCEEMLGRYRHDTRVMEIGGNNFEHLSERDNEFSYYFSNLAHIWGWATWRRAWNLFDFRMNHYAEVKAKKYLDAHYSSLYERHFYQYVYEMMCCEHPKISPQNVWSYQWQFACSINSGLVVIPNRNLVVNLGIGCDATNTTNANGIGSKLKLEEIQFPLKHPEFVMLDKPRVRRDFVHKTSAATRIKSNIKSVMPKPVVEKVLRPIMHALSA